MTQSIHIPLSNGTNEGIDKALMPDGMFKSVRNMHVQRDGRMATRPGLRPLELDGSDGENVTGNPVMFLADGSAVLEQDGSGLKALRWDTDSGGERATLLDGRIPRSNGVRHARSADIGETGTASGTSMPYCAVTRSGEPIIAWRANRDIDGEPVGGVGYVEILDAATLKKKHRITITSDDGGWGDTVNSVQPVGSTQSDTFAVLVTGDHGYGVITYQSVPPYARLSEYEFLTDPLGGNTAVSKPGDISPLPGEDQFITATWDDGWTGNGSANSYNIRLWSFDGSVDPINIYSFANDDSRRIGLLAGETRWYFGTNKHSTVELSVTYQTLFWEILSGPYSPGDAVTIPNGYQYLGQGYPASVSPGHYNDCTGPLFVEESDGTVLIVGGIAESGGAFAGRWTVGSTEDVEWRMVHGEMPITSPVRLRAGDNDPVWFGSEYPAYNNNSGKSVDEIEVAGEAHVVELLLGKDSYPASEYYSAATIVRAGVKMNWWNRYLGRTLPKPVVYTVGHETRVMFPVETTSIHLYADDSAYDSFPDYQTDLRLGCLFPEVSAGTRQSAATRHGETFIAGGEIAFVDQDSVTSSFHGPPLVWIWGGITDPPANGEGDQLIVITSIVYFTFEFRDRNGRLHRSPATSPRRFLQRKEDKEQTGQPDDLVYAEVFVPACLPTQGNGCLLVVYQTDGDGEVPYRRSSISVAPGEYIQFPMHWISGELEASETPSEVLYTQGQLQNDPPPPCRLLTRGRDRVWAGHTERPGQLQASKILNENLGVAWSNMDNFMVSFPDEVTGIAAMDDAVLVLTRGAAFLVAGSGPDNSGNGQFSEPQRIPASTGCVSSESVLATERGVYFQSSRGIEVINRGFSAPQWAGEAMRETIADYPVCLCSVLLPTAQQARWLFARSRSDTSETVCVVLDTRTGAWSTFTYEGVTIIGASGATRDMLAANESSADSLQIETSFEESGGVDAHLETGDIRTAGIQGWGYGRRINIMGRWGGRPCQVRLDIAFDGQAYLPEDSFTWDVNGEEFTTGEVVHFELTLPVQLFSAIQAKVTIVSTDNGPGYSFTVSGLTLWYDVARNGPRISKKGKL